MFNIQDYISKDETIILSGKLPCDEKSLCDFVLTNKKIVQYDKDGYFHMIWLKSITEIVNVSEENLMIICNSSRPNTTMDFYYGYDDELVFKVGKELAKHIV